MTPPGWSPWTPLAPALRMEPRSLAESLNGGQAFRWNPVERNGLWQGVWGNSVARLRLDDDGQLLWSCPEELEPNLAQTLPAYLACTTDFATCARALPLAGDEHLRAAVNTWPHLRILRQPLGETLFAFLCSSTKQIVQIKQICEAVAARFGQELVPGIRALPDWPTLASVSENALRACRLGYRARYIHQTARILAESPHLLDGLDSLPLEQARERHLRLPGVGPKIAACLQLFGAGRLEAFPIDTWILKALRELYGLDPTWRAHHLERFAQIHFAPHPGLAQQFLFARMRQRRTASAAMPKAR